MWCCYVGWCFALVWLFDFGFWGDFLLVFVGELRVVGGLSGLWLLFRFVIVSLWRLWGWRGFDVWFGCGLC